LKEKDGKSHAITSGLGGYCGLRGLSAMTRLIRLPRGIVVQLMFEGVIRQTGIVQPYTQEICDPLCALVEKEGLSLTEQIQRRMSSNSAPEQKR